MKRALAIDRSSCCDLVEPRGGAGCASSASRRRTAPCSRVSPRLCLWGATKGRFLWCREKCHGLDLPIEHRGQAGEGEDAPEGWAVVVFLATPGLPSRGGEWPWSKGVGSAGRRRGSLDVWSSRSAVPRRRKPRPGSSRGESDLLPGALRLEPSLGEMPVGAGAAPHLSPAMVLCHSSITSTPFLCFEECPRFTDGKTKA